MSRSFSNKMRLIRTLKVWGKSWLDPFGKVDMFPAFWNDIFVVWKPFFFSLRTLLKSCVGIFQRKWDWEEFSNFCGKSWANPLGNAKMEFLKSRKYFFSLRTLLTSWFGIFQRKWDSEEISNFWRKSWVNP